MNTTASRPAPTTPPTEDAVPTFVLVATDGTLTPYYVPAKYDTIKPLIGGWLEAIANPYGLTVYGDEEAKLKRLPSNRTGETVIGWGYEMDIVCGPLLITGDVDRNGDTKPLTRAEWEGIQKRHADAGRLAALAADSASGS